MAELDNSKGIMLYTDGSAYNKDRSGGWAFVALDAFGGFEQRSGYEGDATNNSMEMTAIAKGLELVYGWCGPSDILLISDSEIVVLGFNHKARARNANKELWREIEAVAAMHSLVVMEHTRGHGKDAGSEHNFYNNMVDKLAGAARKAGK